jgi:hypothetical protein
MFYVARQNSEPFVTLYPSAGCPEDVELVLDFMAREIIRRLRYEKTCSFGPEFQGYPILR